MRLLFKVTTSSVESLYENNIEPIKIMVPFSDIHEFSIAREAVPEISMYCLYLAGDQGTRHFYQDLQRTYFGIKSIYNHIYKINALTI